MLSFGSLLLVHKSRDKRIAYVQITGFRTEKVVSMKYLTLQEV